MTAYDQLTAEGYLEPRPGRGTLVAAVLATARARRSGPAARRRSAAAAVAEPTRRVRGDPSSGASGTSPGTTSGRVSTRLDLFPSAAWERLLPRAWRDLAFDPGPATTYRYPEGDPRLRAELAAYLGLSRAVRASPGQVVVTSGAQGALATAAAVWLRARPAACARGSGEPVHRADVRGAGVPLVHVPVDDRGLLVERLPEGPRAVMVTPSWQHPGGGTMPIARRMQLLAWAAGRNGLVIEDDGDAEPRYEGHALPSLQGLDDHGHVLYVGSFSRVLFPGLRTGYAVVPEAAPSSLFVARHEAAHRGPGALEQRALALFVAEGHLERHLVRLRAHHAERQAALLDVLATELGTVIRPGRPPPAPTSSSGSRTCA